MGFFNNTVDRLKHYFDIDETEYDSYGEVETEAVAKPAPVAESTMRAAEKPLAPSPSQPETMRRGKKPSQESESSNLQRLNHRQQELRHRAPVAEGRTTIDIKFPKRYEDAPEIVNLLLENASVLIDFQYMAEHQARRCLDYLDGARSVLAGNLKKVSSTMWLLTPVNVTVNIEELRSVQGGQGEVAQYDFDMRR